MPQPQSRTPRSIVIVLVVVLLFACFTIGYEYGTTSTRSAKTSQANADFQLLNNVWDILQKRYVTKPLDRTSAVYGAIRGMLGSLKDPYTVFFSPQESKSFQEEIQGTFDGIGAEIGIKDSHLVVIAPMAGSPSEKAGLVAGDRILNIDKTDTSTLTLDDSVSRIRGAKGTKVVLTIQKPNETTSNDVTVIRDSITIQSVTTKYRSDGTAQIDLTYFGPNTARDFQAAANEIALKHSKGIILDLRNDPGGYLDAAVSVASEFVKSGTTIVSEKEADGTMTTSKSENGGTLLHIPLVVLVDQGSASGSEIVAGALQDLGIGTLVGVTTFGKGTVQQIENLPDGSSVKVTVAKWLTPKGRSISEHGITPDVVVTRTADDVTNGRDPQLDRAIEILQSKITKE